MGGSNNDEVRIQIASNNAVDNADVDYEALVVTVDNTLPPPPPSQWQEATLGNGTGSNTYDANTNTFTISLDNPDSEPIAFSFLN